MTRGVRCQVSHSFVSHGLLHGQHAVWFKGQGNFHSDSAASCRGKCFSEPRKKVTEKCGAGVDFLRLGNGFRHLDPVTSAVWLWARILPPRKLTSGRAPRRLPPPGGAGLSVCKGEDWKSDFREGFALGKEVKWGRGVQRTLAGNEQAHPPCVRSGVFLGARRENPGIRPGCLRFCD